MTNATKKTAAPSTFKNGAARINGNQFNAIAKGIAKHYENITDGFAYAVYIAAKDNNAAKVSQLLQNWIGARGKLIGDGKMIKTWLTRMTVNLVIEDNGDCTIRKDKKGNAMPPAFRVLNDKGEKVAGDMLSGFITSFDEWRKSAMEKEKNSKKTDSIAPNEAGGIIPLPPTGNEDEAPTATMPVKGGEKPLPAVAAAAIIKEAATIITKGGEWDEKHAATIAAALEAAQAALDARVKAEAQRRAELHATNVADKEAAEA
ncbi:MAG: hypothetical protein ACPHVN_00070 [Luminiphilus sp.]